METWADPHTAPHRGLLPLGAAVQAPQNPWGHTLSWPQPTCSWVTASHDPGEGHSLCHSFAPREQGPLCVCSSTTELGLGLATPLECTGPELVEPRCHRPAVCRGSDQPFGHSSSRSGCVPPCSGEGLRITSPGPAARVRRGRRQQAPADRDARRTRQ